MKIKLLDYGIEKMPNRAHENDAGADVYLHESIVIPPRSSMKIGLKFGLRLPDGVEAAIYPRSSLAAKGIVCQIPPIDSGYTGQIHAIVSNMNDEEVRFDKFDRIGQLVIHPIILADFITEDFKQRGNNGLGSTGK